MASDSHDNSTSTNRSHLPFEPKKSKHAKKSGSATLAAANSASVPEPPGIPQVVSQRMVRRMALFCGAPTLLGLLTFPASYFALVHGWLQYPHIAVVIISLGFFGLGALGLTYGVLSASWEEDQRGSMLGWREFRVNFGRLLQEWRLQREKKKS